MRDGVRQEDLLTFLSLFSPGGISLQNTPVGVNNKNPQPPGLPVITNRRRGKDKSLAP